LYVLMLAFAGCGNAYKATEEQMRHLWVREYPGVAKDSIFARAMRWAEGREASKDLIVEYRDSETGTIITRGKKADIYRIDKGKGTHVEGGIDYAMVLDAGDGKARFEFTFFPLIHGAVSEGYYEYAVVHQAARKEFENIRNELSFVVTGKK
jgi:hypothetical protein